VETLDGYLERLASRDAVPGGGSAAALTGAIAAALVAMVGRIRNKAFEGLVTRADRLRLQLNEARLRDERAYAEVVGAQQLPKTTEAQEAARRRALDAALIKAAQTPLRAAALCLDVLKLCDRLTKVPMGALGSDVGCAAELAHAAIAACAYNVRINHRYLRESAAVRNQVARLVRIEGEASAILARVRRAIARG
jgi:formiminotetrahydrofolate cyclodeaminase